MSRHCTTTSQSSYPYWFVPTDGLTLFRRDCLRSINLDWKQLHHMRAGRQQQLQGILDKYSDLFKDEMGIIKGTKVTIHIQPDACPWFFRLRTVPYAYMAKWRPNFSAYKTLESFNQSSF